MKKIGHEVAFWATGDNNPRNGECDFIRLHDGRILCAYSRFYGERWSDYAPADLVGRYSLDEGETWGEEFILLQRDAGAQNFMCPNLMRLPNGDMGLIYGRKYTPNDGSELKAYTEKWFIRSADEGKTWSKPVRCTPERQYNVIENDHVIRLQSGRIVIPLNRPHIFTNAFGDQSWGGRFFVCASDDDGATWREICQDQAMPMEQYSKTGLQETALYQKEDGTVWALSRTDMGFQYEAFSTDDCETWTQQRPNRFFTSPRSPLLMKKAGKYTVAVFNPIPAYTGQEAVELWGRTPLVCAVSTDDGETFPKVFYLEDDRNFNYCYPAIFVGPDYLLISYYHSNGTNTPLNSTKVTKVFFHELEQDAVASAHTPGDIPTKKK